MSIFLTSILYYYLSRAVFYDEIIFYNEKIGIVNDFSSVTTTIYQTNPSMY